MSSSCNCRTSRYAPGALRPDEVPAHTSGGREWAVRALGGRPAGRLLGRRLREALVDEARDLARQALRPRAQLEDRRRLDEATVAQLAGEHVGVREGVDRVARVAEDERRRLDQAPLVARRRDASEEDALEDGARRAGVLADRVEGDVAEVRVTARDGARGPGEHARER